MKKKIEINGLKKSFGPKTILNGVDLDVYEGEILCVIGKSGTGKSVIMKHLVGILEPDSGTITVDGTDFTNADKDTKEKIQGMYGILFQGAALFDSMNIYENVAFGLKRLGKDNKTIDQTVKKLLQKVGLKDVENKKPSELSGGMQKRVGLARSLAVNPRIMLYDEPTTGVDPITAGAVDRLIIDTRDSMNITSIIVTHDMKSAYRIADRIAMLYEGKIIFTGTPDEVKNSDNPYLKQFTEGRSKGPIRVI